MSEMTTIFGFRLIKWLEFWAALYLMAVGSRFLLDPSFIASPVYARWHDAGPMLWGSFMVAVSLSHWGALWLNGRNKIVSRTVRLIAAVAHLIIALQFAVYFIVGGASWGAYTMLMVLAPAILLPVLVSVIEEARDIWEQ